jgi:hypothetical protein
MRSRSGGEINLFLWATYGWAKKARVFVPGKALEVFQGSLILEYNTKNLPIE